jgi:AcrR family transcriptional regulator
MTGSKTEESEIRKPGRPRSAQAHNAILEATLALLGEVGFEALSIEAIAERAKVGKTTIYRRWPSKAELVVDAMKSVHTDVPLNWTGDLRGDLITNLRASFQQDFQELASYGLRLISEIKAYPEIFQALRDTLILPQLKAGIAMVEEAQARGELRSDVDAFLILDLLAGPFLYRAFVSDLVAPSPSPDWPEQLINVLFDGLKPR